ncbi:hypothetical protein ACWGJT_11830 [Streptomyces xantholiticus]
MKYTIVGDWYDCWDLASAFAVVGGGGDHHAAAPEAGGGGLEA